MVIETVHAELEQSVWRAKRELFINKGFGEYNNNDYYYQKIQNLEDELKLKESMLKVFVDSNAEYFIWSRYR